MPNSHAEAEATFLRCLPELQEWVGWFALVRGARLGGIFPTHAAAASAWMSLYGPVPALIRRIGRLPARTAAAIVPPTADAMRTVARDALPASSGPTPPMRVRCNWALPSDTRPPRTEYAA